MPNFHFTFENLKQQYQQAIAAGYQIATCEQYVDLKPNCPKKVLINRVDIDFSVKKAKKLLDLFNALDIKATFFVRLHAPEYNPFSFENYKILKHLIETGHELGYHSEVIDQAAIWGEEAEACLLRDLDIINRMFGINIRGVASHGGMTGLNNLDFWKGRRASDYGMKYEAYDKESTFNLFAESFYISDSEWVRWKCYNKGSLLPGNTKSFAEHLEAEHPLIYLLIHPDTYFDSHFYEHE